MIDLELSILSTRLEQFQIDWTIREYRLNIILGTGLDTLAVDDLGFDESKVLFHEKRLAGDLT